MDDPASIPDSTDWLPTPLSGLSPVETALRCQVCKDFFTTPMITKCSHTFCSLCIRRCLAVDGKCPACRTPEQEISLRRNDTLSTLVEAFQVVRAGILTFAQKASTLPKGAEKASKRKLDQASSDFTTDGDNPSQSRRIRSQSRHTGPTNGYGRDAAISDTEEEGEAQPVKSLLIQLFPHTEANSLAI
jgi:E3 ubiquitin-protein ligase RAD18